MNFPMLMVDPAGWRKRLLDAVARDGRNDIAIAKAAGLGRNYVQQLRTTAKEPSVRHIIKLADALGVSLVHIFLGDDFTVEDEEFFRLLRDLPPEGRAAVLQLLKTARRT